jgi:hypothetical protein
VIFANREIHAEAVPSAPVTVLEVLIDSAAQIARQSDVIESVTSIKRIHPIAPPREILEQILIALKRLVRHAFEKLGNKDGLFLSCHS